MKILIITFTAILLLGLTPHLTKTNIPTNTPPNIETEYVMEEESYIDDIPFDTKTVVDSLFIMEEEGYIDDIPFDTKSVVENL